MVFLIAFFGVIVLIVPGLILVWIIIKVGDLVQDMTGSVPLSLSASLIVYAAEIALVAQVLYSLLLGVMHNG